MTMRTTEYLTTVWKIRQVMPGEPAPDPQTLPVQEDGDSGYDDSSDDGGDDGDSGYDDSGDDGGDDGDSGYDDSGDDGGDDGDSGYDNDDDDD